MIDEQIKIKSAVDCLVQYDCSELNFEDAVVFLLTKIVLILEEKK